MARDSKAAPKGGRPEQEKEEVTGLPALLDQKGTGLATFDYDAEDAGAGFEGTSQADFQIPLLVLVQKGSPQVDKDDPKFDERASVGAVHNTGVGEYYDGDAGILFIPVHRTHKFMEWVPRESGGGLVGIHDPTDPMVIEARQGGAFGKLETPSGNNLKETFSVFGLLVDEKSGVESYAVIPFSSTQIKHYKKWMTKARSLVARNPATGDRVPLPLFAHLYRLRTRGEKNTKGTWTGWDVMFAGEDAEKSRLPKDHPLFIAAKGFAEVAKASEHRVDYAGAGDTGGGEGSEEPDASPAAPGKF